MDIRNKKVLVTGADGFIGSHLVEALLERGCDVRAFVFYNSFNSWGWLDTFTKPNWSRELAVAFDWIKVTSVEKPVAKKGAK